MQASPNNSPTISQTKATFEPQPRKDGAVLSYRQLKRIYASSSRLTANVDRAQIREMIRRGFFINGVWLDELDALEPVAREIIGERDESGRTMLELDSEFWGNAKEIVDLRAKIAFEERLSGAKSESGKLCSGNRGSDFGCAPCVVSAPRN